jgi:predicted small metal-binding protein
MSKEIACHNVVPGCGFKATAASEDELLRQVAEHARVAHGVTEVSPELLATVRSAIRDAD